MSLYGSDENHISGRHNPVALARREAVHKKRQARITKAAQELVAKEQAAAAKSTVTGKGSSKALTDAAAKMKAARLALAGK